MTNQAQSNYFVHTLLRARDWQHRPEFDDVCDWWRSGGRGVCALVGIGGAGKTAISERFLRVLPHVTEPEPQLPKDSSLLTPNRLFVYSFYKDNEDRFFGELYAWLKGAPNDDSARHPSFHQTLDLLISVPCLLVLDGLEKVQDDGSRGGVFGQVTDGRLSDLVQRLASGLVPGVAAVITTRFPIAELEEQRPPHFRPINVEEISDDAGVSLLTTRGVHGAKTELLRIVHDCGNHALTVDLAGGYIVEFGHRDPATPLQLETTPKEESEINAEPKPQRRYVMRQERRFARVAERYREGFAKGDPASLALLERVGLFRLGADAATLTSIFTGKDKEEISGKHLARLSQTQLEQKLRLLTEMRLLEANEPSHPSTPRSQRSTRYTIHPAVRDGFLSWIGTETAEATHEAIHRGLEVSLGDAPGKNPSDSTTLNLLEEILHHTLQSGHVPEAWDLYRNRIGGGQNLIWRLGGYERGERICRAFAGGQRPENIAETVRFPDRGRDDPTLASPAKRDELPYLALPQDRQGAFFNEWATYLLQLGQLTAATRCYEIASQWVLRQGFWGSASVATQNMCDVSLLSGRLRGTRGGLAVATEAVRIAERADDVRVRFRSHARRANTHVLRGEVSAALADFRAALQGQRKVDGNDNPLWSLRGIQHTGFLVRLGRREEAKKLTEANREILEPWGPDDPDKAQCNLVLSGLPGDALDRSPREALCRSARDWAVARDAKEVLCWSALVRARISLSALGDQQSTRQGELAQRLSASTTSIDEGLKIARDCGYGIFHIDLLLERARLHLFEGDPQSALDDIELALDEGIETDDETGQPELLAANHEECGYAWAIPFGLQLRAEAQLLQGAQQLGVDSYAPAEQMELPDAVTDLIEEAKKNLNAAMDHWLPLRDLEPEHPDQNFKHPESGEEYNYRATETWQILKDLAGGVLTGYPLKATAATTAVESTLRAGGTASIGSSNLALGKEAIDRGLRTDTVRIRMDIDRSEFSLSVQNSFVRDLADLVGTSPDRIEIEDVLDGSVEALVRFEDHEAFVRFINLQTDGQKELRRFRDTWTVLSIKFQQDGPQSHPCATPIEVGIIVALREEFRELHRELPASVPVKDDTTGASDYLFQREVAGEPAYSCAATFVGMMGPTEAALATERFIGRREPKTIVMLGIGAGIDNGVRLGDVVISTHVGRYLERAKIESGKRTFDIKPGGDSFPCSSDLVRATQDFEFAHQSKHIAWKNTAGALLGELVAEAARTKLIEKDWIAEQPNFLEGPVASGPVVVASEEFLSWVKSLNRNYLALEMEGGGMLAAVYSHADPGRTMMLRGISDFGDNRKKELDKIGKGGLRRYATRNAIHLLWGLMEAGILPRR